jgi:NADH:ubiquinone oxidoreductase subunit K
MTTTLTLFLFLCGLAGFILNRNNVILLIVAIELLLLAVIISRGALIFI